MTGNTPAWSAAALSMAVLALSINGAAAQSLDVACEPFGIERHLDRIAFIDHGGDGVSVGDQRILRFDLMSQNGLLIGSQQVLATVVHGSMDGEHEMMIDGTVVLDGGILRVSTIGPLQDPADTSTASADTLVWAVDGGTARFAGAYGTMTTVPREDGASDVTFEISCLD